MYKMAKFIFSPVQNYKSVAKENNYITSETHVI